MILKRVAGSFVAIVLCLSILPGLTIAAEYNVSQSVDFTGPYAVIMKPVDDTAKVLFQWWNDTKGKELGIKLVRKTYETRYDPTVVASLWPSILAGDKPIAHLGLGGPDIAALMKRAPNDKVPIFMGTATYGFAWLPDQWIFQSRPTYAHELAGFLNWVHMNKIKDRPIKVASISSKVTPAYVDQVNGLEALTKTIPWIQSVHVEWVQMNPVSLVSEVRRLARYEPDFIYIGTNTNHVIGTIRAQKELGIQIPLILSSHNGVQMCAAAAKDMTILEGHYDTYSCDPAINMNKPGAKVFNEYAKKLGLDTKWSEVSLIAGSETILMLRAVERAAAAVGPDKITGETIYKAMFEKPFTEEELLGMLPTQTYTKDAPFSLQDIKVISTTVKDGKQTLVSNDWIPVPTVPSWVDKK